MEKTRKPISHGLKITLIVTIIFFVLFWVCLLIFGALAAKSSDPDLKDGIGGMFSYHFSDIKGLFIFKFHDASNIIYVFSSGLLYFFIFIAILYLIAGILIIVKKKRPIIIISLVAALLVIFVYMLVATGLPKYWAIINKRAPFESDGNLIAPSFGIIAFAALFILASYALYFYSLFEAFKNPATKEEDSENTPNDEVLAEVVPQEKPVVFEPIIEEEIKEEKPEPKPEVKPMEEKKEEEKKPDVSGDDLKSILSEVLRDIVRDEIARNNANQRRSNSSEQAPANSSFGGPLVIQYFNGNQTEAPKKEEPKIEVPPVEEKKEAPKPEPVKAEPQIKEPVVVQPEEKKPIIRIPFTERMLSADKEMQANYNELKNEILSYGVNSRVSNSGDTFRLHCKTYVKITIAGLSLKLYFALNPDDYKDSTLPIQNAGHKGIYAEIPLVFKVKSGLSMRRCKQLIQDVFDKNGLEQGEISNIDWVEELKKNPNDEEDD